MYKTRYQEEKEKQHKKQVELVLSSIAFVVGFSICLYIALTVTFPA